MPVLVIREQGQPERVFPLLKRETVVGRLPECDIALSQKGVSKRHCVVLVEASQYYLRDNGSLNRSFLNRTLVEHGRLYNLRDRDAIYLCHPTDPTVELHFYQKYPPDPILVMTNDEASTSTTHILEASRSDLIASSVRSDRKLKAILEIARSIASSLEVNDVAPRILEALLTLFGQADRACLALIAPESTPGSWIFDRTFCSARRGQGESFDQTRDDSSRITISRTIARLVLEQKKAILIRDSSNPSTSVEANESLQEMQIRSTMCTPLVTADGRIVGLLSLDTHWGESFQREDLDVLEAVGRQAALGIQNASLHHELLRMEGFRRSLELGRSIVDLLLPGSVPTPPGYEFFAHYRAAHMVGGDFYDFVQLDDNRLAILVGDVAGKGVPAALLMSRFSGECRAAVFANPEPAEALAHLNRLMCRSRFDGTFVTLSLNVLDLARGTLACGSAGHDSVLVRHANGTVTACDDSIRGCVLGCDPAARYGQAEIKLQAGDVASIFTDGVTDACNLAGQRYDSMLGRRLIPRLAGALGGPSAVGNAVLQDIDAFVGGQNQADDITLICFGPAGPAASMQR